MAWLYAMYFTCCLTLILWLWIRFLGTWNSLRNMLERLEGSPLRFAFSRLTESIFTKSHLELQRPTSGHCLTYALAGLSACEPSR